MGNPRARYTLEFKLEAVRMVKGGQSLAAVAKMLDIRPQTLHNWIKAEQQGLAPSSVVGSLIGFVSDS